MTDGTNLTKRGRRTFCSRRVGGQWLVDDWACDEIPAVDILPPSSCPGITAIRQPRVRCSRQEDARVCGAGNRQPSRSQRTSQRCLRAGRDRAPGDRGCVPARGRVARGELGPSHRGCPTKQALAWGHYLAVSGCAGRVGIHRSKEQTLSPARPWLPSPGSVRSPAPARLPFPLTSRLLPPSTHTRRHADDTISLTPI